MLATIFYILAIIYMLLGIAILAAILVLVFIIKKKITDVMTMIEQKIAVFTRMTSRTAGSAAEIGAFAAEKVSRGIGKLQRRRR